LALQGSLNSELVLTDEEQEQLHALARRLPPRPARLTEAPPDESSLAMPQFETWDDEATVREYQTYPNFRAFKALLEQQLRLWTSERRVLQQRLAVAQPALAQLERLHSAQNYEAEATGQELEQLRLEVKEIADFDGHRRRSDYAAAEAIAARKTAVLRTAHATEFQAARKASVDSFMQCRMVHTEAESALAAAKDSYDMESTKLQRYREDLERQIRRLEGEARLRMKHAEFAGIDECRIRFLQHGVETALGTEAEQRAALRADVRSLLARLQILDRQLAVDPLYA